MYSGFEFRLLRRTALVVLALAAQVVWAGVGPTLYVDDDHPADPAPGDPTISNPLEDGSPAAPFDAIQEAIDAASDGGVVVVADGVYRGPGNRDLDLHGSPITVRSANGPESCIIDSEFSGRGFSFTSGEGPDSVVEGFTIRHGFVMSALGGGIRCSSSSPTIRNCIITGNEAAGLLGAGGGISCVLSNPTIINCLITGNLSSSRLFGRGNGIFLSESSPKIVDCVISDNVGSFDDISGGGGIFCTSGSHPSLLRTEISRNAATFGGGMVCQMSSNPTLRSCVIRDNTALSTGGILLTGSSSPTIRSCLITGNIGLLKGQEGGGIDCLDGAAPLIINCTITANSTRGIGCSNAAPIIESCVIAGHEDDLFGCLASHSCVEDGDAGEGNVAGDPLFAGPNDYRLDPASSCIDAGDPNFLPAPGETDLDGHARRLCSRVDSGAYEFGIGDFTCDRSVGLLDFASWLNCMTSPAASSQMEESGSRGALGVGCAAFDFDGDLDVDLADYAGFANAIQTDLP